MSGPITIVRDRPLVVALAVLMGGAIALIWGRGRRARTAGGAKTRRLAAPARIEPSAAAIHVALPPHGR